MCRIKIHTNVNVWMSTIIQVHTGAAFLFYYRFQTRKEVAKCNTSIFFQGWNEFFGYEAKAAYKMRGEDMKHWMEKEGIKGLRGMESVKIICLERSKWRQQS